MHPTLIIPLVIAFIVLLVAVTIIVTFNGIVEAANSIRRAWADTIVIERQKTRILDSLKEQVSLYTSYEGPLLAKITSLRSQITELGDSPDHAGLAAVKNQTQELMGGLKVAVEAYPELEASPIMRSLMQEITEQEENVSAALQIYNATVEHFNNSIQTFFGSWVNSTFNKKSLAESFTDSAAKGFEFIPKLP